MIAGTAAHVTPSVRRAASFSTPMMCSPANFLRHIVRLSFLQAKRTMSLVEENQGVTSYLIAEFSSRFETHECLAVNFDHAASLHHFEPWVFGVGALCDNRRVANAHR